MQVSIPPSTFKQRKKVDYKLKVFLPTLLIAQLNPPPRLESLREIENGSNYYILQCSRLISFAAGSLPRFPREGTRGEGNRAAALEARIIGSCR